VAGPMYAHKNKKKKLGKNHYALHWFERRILCRPLLTEPSLNWTSTILYS